MNTNTVDCSTQIRLCRARRSRIFKDTFRGHIVFGFIFNENLTLCLCKGNWFVVFFCIRYINTYRYIAIRMVSTPTNPHINDYKLSGKKQSQLQLLISTSWTPPHKKKNIKFKNVLHLTEIKQVEATGHPTNEPIMFTKWI